MGQLANETDAGLRIAYRKRRFVQEAKAARIDSSVDELMLVENFR